MSIESTKTIVLNAENFVFSRRQWINQYTHYIISYKHVLSFLYYHRIDKFEVMRMVIHHYVDEKSPLFLGVMGFRLSSKESEQAAGWLVNYGLTMV